MNTPLLLALHELEAEIKAGMARQQANQTEYAKLVMQLVAVGVCPCVAMGRASTCCGEPK
jgi:hypothetical protein